MLFPLRVVLYVCVRLFGHIRTLFFVREAIWGPWPWRSMPGLASAFRWPTPQQDVK